jgi:hypothetical protein
VEQTFAEKLAGYLFPDTSYRVSIAGCPIIVNILEIQGLATGDW